MEKLFKLIEELGEIRNGIPQLLYCDALYPDGWITLRTEILKFRKKHPDIKEIDVILNSPGGTPDDAYRAIRTLRENFEKVNIVIPFWAKSGATLLSLGASQIIMDEGGEFGPIDIQVPKQKEDSPGFDFESALNDENSLRLLEDRASRLFRFMFIDYHASKDITINKNDLSKQLLDFTCKFYEPLLRQINPYTLGEKKRKSDVSVSYANRILIQYNKISRADRDNLVDFLVTACPDHGYVIDYRVISTFLPNVIRAKDISTDYEFKLDEISIYFMDDADGFQHIGFIPQIEAVSEEGPESQVAQEITDAIIKPLKS